MRVRRVGKGQQGREGLHSATGTRDGIEQGGNGLGVLNHARTTLADVRLLRTDALEIVRLLLPAVKGDR